MPVHDDRVWFEFLILEGAQAGLSWSTIMAKREAYRRAFSRFNPASIAKYDAKKVKQLLGETDFTLQHIAELAGFDHPEYLSVAFKKAHGLTPGSYRQQHRRQWGDAARFRALRAG